jgi:hypothetical protein
MKNLLFLWIVILLLCVPGVSGFSVSSVNVNPSGDLKDGAPVTVTCEIPRTGILLYDQLVITTDLDTPVWDPVVIVREQETPLNPAFAHGNILTLNGAVYNYPAAVPVKVRVVLKGTVPRNHTTSPALAGYPADGCRRRLVCLSVGPSPANARFTANQSSKDRNDTHAPDKKTGT